MSKFLMVSFMESKIPHPIREEAASDAHNFHTEIANGDQQQ